MKLQLHESFSNVTKIVNERPFQSCLFKWSKNLGTREWYFVSLNGNHILMWHFMEQSSFYLTWWKFNYYTSTINSTTTRFLHTLQAKLVKFWTMNSLIHISKDLWLDYLPIDSNLLVDSNGLIWPQDLITMSSKGVSKNIIIICIYQVRNIKTNHHFLFVDIKKMECYSFQIKIWKIWNTKLFVNNISNEKSYKIKIS